MHVYFKGFVAEMMMGYDILQSELPFICAPPTIVVHTLVNLTLHIQEALLCHSLSLTTCSCVAMSACVSSC